MRFRVLAPKKVLLMKTVSKFGYIIGRYSIRTHLVEYKQDTPYYNGITKWDVNPKYAQIYKTSKEAEDYRKKKCKGRKTKIIFISKVVHKKSEPYSSKDKFIGFTKINSFQMLSSIMHKL